MKVKLIRPCSTRNPEWDPAEAEKSRLSGQAYGVPHSIDVQTGHIIDHPDSWKLIRMGYAVPEDDEARGRAGLSQDQIAEAIKGQDRMQEGYKKAVKKSRKKKGLPEESPAEESTTSGE